MANDLLRALMSEKRVLEVRVHTIEVWLKKKTDVISKTPYTDTDLKEMQQRLDEVNVAIEAVRKYRRENNIEVAKTPQGGGN